MRVLGVIPARYGSTRFPGKPLATIAGKPMVEHVYRNACSAKVLERVVVATDDERIAVAVKNFGGECIMTRADHPSGFDRVVEVAARFPDYTHYANIQGDEPLLPKENITGALSLFTEHPANCHIATAAVPFQSITDFTNENMVKVVLACDHRALYFSRAAIPFYRRGSFSGPVPALKHQGLYIYSREALHKMAHLPVVPLEEAEGLEQLRFLYHGFNIYVFVGEKDSPGVDVPEDLIRVENLLR